MTAARNPHGMPRFDEPVCDYWPLLCRVAEAVKPFDAMTDETVQSGAPGGWFELLKAARDLLKAEGLRP